MTHSRFARILALLLGLCTLALTAACGDTAATTPTAVTGGAPTARPTATAPAGSDMPAPVSTQPGAAPAGPVQTGVPAMQQTGVPALTPKP